MQVIELPAFKRGLKKIIKQHKLQEYRTYLEVLPLLESKTIGTQHKNHRLTGDMSGHYELHLSGDCLLLYSYRTDDTVLLEALLLENIGTHKELFSSTNVNKYPELVQQVGDEFIKTMDEENFDSFRAMSQCYGWDSTDIKEEIEYMINKEFNGFMYGSDIEDANGHEYKYRSFKSMVMKYIDEATESDSFSDEDD